VSVGGGKRRRHHHHHGRVAGERFGPETLRHCSGGSNEPRLPVYRRRRPTILADSSIFDYYYYYYAAFNAPCVGHKDDESQAQSSARIVHQVTACLHASLSSCVYR